MRNSKSSIAVWLIASLIGALSCSLTRLEAHIGEEYLPMGNDAFYHAARILDAVREPSSFYEFDRKIHAPEGSLLTWPWGYDFVMAKAVRLVAALGVSHDPVETLLWLPLLGVFVAVGLLILICRELRLSTWPTALAALCMALMPTTQWLYGFAQIDHHGAEMIFVLAALASGMAWFREPKLATGVAAGAAFGLSLGVHNGLFIIQLPFLVALFVLWLQGHRAPRNAAFPLVAALLVFAITVLIPSLPFREGKFEFYTLSWFHFYVVCCTGLVVIFVSSLESTKRSVLILLVVGIALAIPLIHQMRMAEAFVSGTGRMLDVIAEMQSPLSHILNERSNVVTQTYSLLIWISPITFLICIAQAWRERAQPRVLFWIACIGGLALMSLQLRMHYFGSYALYLPYLVLVQRLATSRPVQEKSVYLGATLLLLLAYIPQLRHVLMSPYPIAGDGWFDRLHPIFPALKKACAEDPGIVLADTNAGHYIRYYSDCSVIANNFLLTEQHFKKVDEMMRLFTLSPEEFLKEAPYVKYVLVRPGDILPKKDGDFTYRFWGKTAPELANQLLLAPLSELPPEFHLIGSVNFELRFGKTQVIPYARLFKVESSGTGVTK